MLRAPTFHDLEVVLEPGDSLVLYTDGVTEGRRGVEFYGEERLDDVVEFQGGDPRDDIVVVAIRLP